jgi:hypothetical protein
MESIRRDPIGAMRKFILTILLVALSSSAAAALWKCTDAGGAVHYLPEAVTDGSKTCVALVEDQTIKAEPAGDKKPEVGFSDSKLSRWVLLGSDKDSVTYVDPRTIRKDGARVKMWSMFDYKTVKSGDGKFFRSYKAQYEYDCKQEQVRMLYFSVHAEAMGGGGLVASARASANWLPIAPQSTGEIQMKFACERWAEWIDIGSNKTNTTYVALSSLDRTGSKAIMWNLVDLRTAARATNGAAYLSLKSQQENDCDEERVRTLHMTAYSENMGEGDIVYDNADVSEWVSFPRNSFNKIQWKMACGK